MDIPDNDKISFDKEDATPNLEEMLQEVKPLHRKPSDNYHAM